MARVLVVGGAGYVGSQVAKSLARSGHQVVVFDNFSTGFRSLVKFGSLIEGDLLSPDQVCSALHSVNPEAVMHFAAKALVGESVADPGLYYQTNVVGTLHLLNALRTLSKPPVFIFSSTCSVYGNAQHPLTERDPLCPMNPYARTKLMVEQMLADFDASHGLRSAVLRYFNAAGCDSEGEIGELHDPETHLIPRLLLHALDPSTHTVQIHGDSYPTEDGTCIRDFVHVEDLAEAHIAAMHRLISGAKGDVFNLGTSRGSSVREVIRMVEKITRKKLHIPVGPARAGDPPLLVAGSQKARIHLGWEPKHDLESIVKTAWHWTKKVHQNAQ